MQPEADDGSPFASPPSAAAVPAKSKSTVPRLEIDPAIRTVANDVAAALGSPPNADGGERKMSLRKARKGPTTRTACARCRRSKVKCDGKHPTCSRCAKHNEQCIYDVPQEGMTRMQFMHQELQRKTQSFNAIMTLLNYLRSQPDAQAAALLARIRMGDNVESLVEAFAPDLQGTVQNHPITTPTNMRITPPEDTSVSPTLPSRDISPTTAQPLPSPAMYDVQPLDVQPLDVQPVPSPATYDFSFRAPVSAMAMMPTYTNLFGTQYHDTLDVREEVARMRRGRQGMPQISFGGIVEWSMS